MNIIRQTLVALACITSVSAWAQQPVTNYAAPWNAVGNTASLSVSNSSTRVQLGWALVVPLPTPSPSTAIVCNTGSVVAYVALGNSGVTATTSGFPVQAGACPSLALNGASYIAGITASSTTTLTISSGTGQASNGSSSGGGGAAGGMLTTAGNAVLPTARYNIINTPPTCDGLSATDGAVTSAAPTSFSSASASFSSADVGKRISINGAGAAGASLVTTIASVTNATHVVLTSGNASGGNVTGAIWGYGTDYSATINAALATGVQLPSGECGIASTITYTNKSILLGNGSGNSNTAPTKIIWLGAVGGTQISGDVNGQLNAVQIGGFIVDGLGSAAVGMVVHGVYGSQFYPILTQNQTSKGWDIDLSNGIGVQDNDFYTPESAQTGSAKGFILGATSTAAANVNHNRFYGMRAYTQNGTGLDCVNADSNAFYSFFGQTTGSGLSIDLGGSNTTGVLCGSNRWYFAGAGGGVTARGGTAPSADNYLELITTSGEPCPPTIEAGATIDYRCMGSQGSVIGATTFTSSVGVGGGTATTASLDVDSTVAFATAAKFGPSLPVYLLSGGPVVGFNGYWKTGGNFAFGKGSSSNYGGFLGLDYSTGAFTFSSSTAAGNADATLTPSNTLSISRTGDMTTPGHFIAGAGTDADCSGWVICSGENTTQQVRLVNSGIGKVDLSLATSPSFRLNFTDTDHSSVIPLAVSLDGTKTVALAGPILAPGLSTSSAATTGTLCWTTGTGNVNVDTTTTCLASSMRFKHDWKPLSSGSALAEVMRYKPGTFVYNDDMNIPGVQTGFLAEDMDKVNPDLVGYGEDGKPLKLKNPIAFIAKLTAALQEQQREIEALKRRIRR